jgi:NACalpha-BTF3-like transcription factor
MIQSILEYLHPIDLQNFFLAYKGDHEFCKQNVRLTDKKFEEIYFGLPWYHFVDYKNEITTVHKLIFEKYVAKVYFLLRDVKLQNDLCDETYQDYLKKKLKSFNQHFLAILFFNRKEFTKNFKIKFFHHTPILNLLENDKSWNNYVDFNFEKSSNELKNILCITEEDIDVIRSQGDWSYEIALKALIKKYGDIVNAIMDLEFGEF